MPELQMIANKISTEDQFK